MDDFESYYDVLEIPESSSQEEIKKAYRKLAHEYHPDKNLNATEKVKRLAEEKFKETQEAYDTLKNSSKKAQYDSKLKEVRERKQRSQASNAAGSQQTGKRTKGSASQNSKAFAKKQVLWSFLGLIVIVLLAIDSVSNDSQATEPANLYQESQPSISSVPSYPFQSSDSTASDTTETTGQTCGDRALVHKIYDLNSGECVCDSGYTMNSYGTCITQSLSCADQYPSSYWDGAQCACIGGLSWNSNHTACVTPLDRNTQQCQAEYGTSSYYTGQLNSNGGPICGCSNGSQWNSETTACLSTAELDQSCLNEWPNTYYTGQKDTDGKNLCGCKSGYYWNKDQTGCYSTSQFTQSCQSSYGPGSGYSTYSNSCTCNYGYTWSDSANWCIKNQ